jgi:MbtH protein
MNLDRAHRALAASLRLMHMLVTFARCMVGSVHARCPFSRAASSDAHTDHRQGGPSCVGNSINEAGKAMTMTYKVVVNDEEQYSIWPTYKDCPVGWREEGRAGSKEECLQYIQTVWTDMRPRSLRGKLDPSKDSSRQ